MPYLNFSAMKTIKNDRTSIKTYLIGLISALFLLTSLSLRAEEFTKTYKEKYAVQKGATLSIDNKYGNVHCQNWEESSIAITVTITVDASSQEKADKVFDKINIALSGSPTMVSGVTTMGSINNADFSINYDIMMPKWANIDLENQFGEIYIAEVDGTAQINLEYGDLEVVALNGLGTDLTLKFSKGSVDYLKDGKVQVEYGKFESDGTGPLSIVSRFSGVDISKVEKLNLDSQYDEIELGAVGQIIAISRFSGVDVDKITGSFEFDSEYGDINVSYVGAAFGTGKVRNSFAGVDLTFDPKAAFNIDAQLEFGDISYPKTSSSVSKTTEDYTTNILKGKIGTAASPAGQLTIRSKHGDAEIEFAE
jgi:hypothetical protein